MGIVHLEQVSINYIQAFCPQLLPEVQGNFKFFISLLDGCLYLLLILLVQITKGIYFLEQILLHFLLLDLQNFQQLLVPLQLFIYKCLLSLSELSSKSFVSFSQLSLHSSSLCWRAFVRLFSLFLFSFS